MTTTTFNVSKGNDGKASMEFVNSEQNDITKQKSLKTAKLELKELAKTLLKENVDKFNASMKKIEANIINSQNQSMDSDMKREKNMNTMSKYLRPTK